jgi:hypothetical protein
MKRFLIGTVAVVAVAFAGAPLKLNNLIDLLSQVYPTDSAKRQALDVCVRLDPSFNRLDRAARESCFQRQGTPNPVTLQNALAWEGASANDVRVMEATQQFQRKFLGPPVDDPYRQ